MKNHLLISAIFLCSYSFIFAQNTKTENLSSIQQNKNLYSTVVARDISKNLGLTKEEESKVLIIYQKYMTESKSLRQNNPSSIQEELPNLEKTRETEINLILNDKQKEKYIIYKGSKLLKK